MDVRIYDKCRGCNKVVSARECGFGYRTSVFKSNESIIISARLSLTNEQPQNIRQRIEKFKKIRISTQPTASYSLGSTFKRSNGFSAGALIDSCGLKGYRIGGAEISTVHAGFIVNSGGATADDYLKLCDYAAEQVYKIHGVRLEREIEVM
jgi:UDP-N-acetylmuramate dehydrogenase